MLDSVVMATAAGRMVEDIQTSAATATAVTSAGLLGLEIVATIIDYLHDLRRLTFRDQAGMDQAITMTRIEIAVPGIAVAVGPTSTPTSPATARMAAGPHETTDLPGRTGRREKIAVGGTIMIGDMTGAGRAEREAEVARPSARLPETGTVTLTADRNAEWLTGRF